MRHWVIRATTGAMERVQSHANLVGLANTEEFTFRSMFMAEAVKLIPRLTFQTEWCTFDLLAQHDGRPILIEFKYYLLRRSFNLDGTPGRYKGGAGPKNEAEFWRCLQKLGTRATDQIKDRFLVLVYERDYARRSRHSFHDSYGRLEPNGLVTDVWPSGVGQLEGRVLQVRPASGPDL